MWYSPVNLPEMSWTTMRASPKGWPQAVQSVVLVRGMMPPKFRRKGWVHHGLSLRSTDDQRPGQYGVIRAVIVFEAASATSCT